MKLRQRIRERPREIQLTVDDMKRIMVCAEPHVRWAMRSVFQPGNQARHIRTPHSAMVSSGFPKIDGENLCEQNQ
jgi:hypothetical protein